MGKPRRLFPCNGAEPACCAALESVSLVFLLNPPYQASIQTTEYGMKVLGKTINHMGPAGAGQKTKLCNQVLVCGNLLAACEALSLGEKVGLDPKRLIEAIGAGAAGSWQFSNLGPRMIDQDNAPGFAINLLQKDLRLVAEASERFCRHPFGRGLPALAGCSAWSFSATGAFAQAPEHRGSARPCE